MVVEGVLASRLYVWNESPHITHSYWQERGWIAHVPPAVSFSTKSPGQVFSAGSDSEMTRGWDPTWLSAVPYTDRVGCGSCGGILCQFNACMCVCVGRIKRKKRATKLYCLNNNANSLCIMCVCDGFVYNIATLLDVPYSDEWMTRTTLSTSSNITHA